MILPFFTALATGEIHVNSKSVIQHEVAVTQTGKWETYTYRLTDVDGADWRVGEIYHDGRLSWTSEGEGVPGGGSADMGFIHSPNGAVFAVYISHSWNGHGKDTLFFSLNQAGRVKLIHQEDSENGGPVFRDLDGDGEHEWIWDSSDWYIDYGDVPKELYAYKPGKDGVLKLWKTIPNKHGMRLPWLGGPGWMQVEKFGFHKYE